LIAQQDHIKPEDVTLEHIHEKRRKNVDVKYDFSTRYGGYVQSAKRVLTPAQTTEIVKAAYRFSCWFLSFQVSFVDLRVRALTHPNS